MRSHEIDYRIIGESIQIVEVELDPGETVIAEAGAMLYMEDGIQFDTKMGDGSAAAQDFLGKLIQVGTRVLTGESIFMTHFTNLGSKRARLGFSAPYPGTIVPINLAQAQGNELIVQKDGFLCAALGTQLTITLNKRIGTGLVGGEGFILQKLSGDGMAFVHAGGTLIERQLNNESLRIDTGCIVAYESSLDFDIIQSGGLRSMIFGGEGIFLASIRGTGRVWLQSMPIRKLIQALAPYGKNRRKESGSILGDFLEP
ncbi:TIGR00266 family protein [Fulvivirga sedimenti]|uniref:TIGR00266 family protein n=1 Tax=Fulvivirga sedimenti TaxID=2879465 RepID=A0A9X1KV70_9BACT|nr:TIGR00266 family protein [Fulvivirga sedimenti]MCA6074403.1 TIGR00266 family protein [Fulvivirga sedimenti]